MIENIKEITKRSHELYLKQGKYKCPECDGNGYVINIIDVWRTETGHHPSCDGTCRMCPIPIQVEDQEHEEIECVTCNRTGISPNKNISELLMNIITDLCDALKCWKGNKRVNYTELESCYHIALNGGENEKLSKQIYLETLISFQENTFEDKLADVFIGLFDLFHDHVIIIRNGGELQGTTTREINFLIKSVIYIILQGKIDMSINTLYKFCTHHNIDIEKHIEAKLNYLEANNERD